MLRILPPRGAGCGAEAAGALTHGLESVVLATEALTIGDVVALAVIPHLADVVGEHPILRRGLGAAIAAIDGFAPPSCTFDDRVSPCPVFGREVEAIDALDFRLE